MTRLGRAAFFGLLLAVSGTASAEVVSNQTVLDLEAAGLGDAAIIAKIETSETTFDTSTTAIIALSQAGVSSDVIAAMIAAGRSNEVRAEQELSADSPDPTVPHYPGVYLLADWLPEPRMQSIDATTSNQARTGGFLGYALTGGIVPMRFKTAIPNRSARVFAAQRRPVFYFYFDQSVGSLSSGVRDSFWASGAVTSPAEFSLVRFDIRRDRREAEVGSFNITGARQGVADGDQIALTYETVSPGVFRVTPGIDLQPGEYGFIYSAATGGGGVGASGVGAMTSRIFDFSIRDASATSVP